MPRKRQDPVALATMEPISLRFTQPQMKRIKRITEQTGLPMTELIRRFVDDGLRAYVE